MARRLRADGALAETLYTCRYVRYPWRPPPPRAAVTPTPVAGRHSAPRGIGHHTPLPLWHFSATVLCWCAPRCVRCGEEGVVVGRRAPSAPSSPSPRPRGPGPAGRQGQARARTPMIARAAATNTGSRLAGAALSQHYRLIAATVPTTQPPPRQRPSRSTSSFIIRPLSEINPQVEWKMRFAHQRHGNVKMKRNENTLDRQLHSH